MTFLPWLVLLLLVVFSSLWIVKAWAFNSGEVADLVKKLDPVLASRLYPLVSPTVCSADRQLNLALGGIRGIRQMHRETGTFVTLAIRIRMQYRDDALHATQEIVRNALYLRIMTWAALLEALIAITVPALPRVQARSCALLYCDVNASLREVLSIFDLPLIDGI